jgi:hypothetical protein
MPKTSLRANNLAEEESCVPNVISGLAILSSKQIIVYRITGFFNFFHRPVFLGVETRRFGNSICFLPQVKWGEDTYSVGPFRKS